MKMLVSKQGGFTMIDILLAVGIVGILSSMFATLIVNVSSEQRILQEKFSVLELQNSLLLALANPDICMALLNKGTPVLDLSEIKGGKIHSSRVVPYPELRLGTHPASPLIAARGEPLPGYAGRHMVVRNISLKRITFTGSADRFIGDLEVELEPDTVSRSYKPVSTKVGFTVKPNPTLGSSLIASCGPPSESPPGTLCGTAIDPLASMPESMKSSLGGGSSGFASMYSAYTVLCQGHDPAVSCPSGYTKRIGHMFWFVSCVKN